MQKIKKGDVVIVTAGKDKGRTGSVLQVVEKVKEISGNNFNVINKSRRAGDPEFLVANSDLCKKILKWVPKYDTLDVIIKDSLDWENKIK